MKIVAASCCKVQQVNPQPVWAEIQAERPDALVLLGDNVYLNHDQHSDPDRLGRELRELYALQLAEPNFAALLLDMRQRGAPVVAIYDDHDFLGNNRYGGDVPDALREAPRAELIRAFAPQQTGSEVYRLHRIGLVDLVVVDARFHRSRPDLSANDRDAVLGTRQWQWLEQVVASRRPDAYLALASSTTLHTFADESWEQYPAAFQRLVKLLAPIPGAFVLSGDVHRNAAYDDSGVVEIVTSAVARRGLVFGAARKNYAVLGFDTTAMHVDLRSLKVGWRIKFSLPRANWVLP
jgi:alkaline phosphatase D